MKKTKYKKVDKLIKQLIEEEVEKYLDDIENSVSNYEFSDEFENKMQKLFCDAEPNNNYGNTKCEKTTSEFYSEEINYKLFNKYKIKQRRKVLNFPVCAVVIIGIFLVFNFPGQALSKSIGYTITRILEGEIDINHMVDAENISNINLPKGEYSYSSVQDAAENMGAKLVYIDSNDIDSVKVDVTIEPTLAVIGSIYYMKGGFEISSIQTFVNDGSQWNIRTVTNGNKVYEKQLSNGEKMYISKNIDCIYGIAVWRDTNFLISSVNMNTDMFESMISLLRETK